MESGLVWSSLAWKDGTKYDGLTRDGKLHSHGVLTFPNKDRYQGMFEDGKMHGAGVYIWKCGMIYRGDWVQGVMHGCGTRIWKDPDGSMQAAEGKFFGNEFVGDIMPCGGEDSLEAAVDADMAAFQARSFLVNNNKQQDQLASSGPSNRRRQLVQTPSKTDGTKYPFNISTAGATRSSSTVTGQQHEHDEDPRLQHLVQRLVADQVAQHKMQTRQLSNP